MAWSVSKLSETYESRAAFELAFVNLPDSLLLNTSQKGFFNAKLRASGFQFLSYGISPKKLKLDLKEVLFSEENYYMPSKDMKLQFEKQLPNAVSIIELEGDKLVVDLYQVIHKEVPITPNISLQLEQNYLLEGELQIEPKTVILKGPSNEIADIDALRTEQLILNNLSEDFLNTVEVVKPSGLINGEISVSSVVLSGKIVRFSEKEYIVPITTINLPVGFRIKMFPDKVSLVCKASVAALKNIDTSDFKVIVNYDDINQSNNQLKLQLVNSPENVYAVRLLEDQIEFVLEKL